MTTEPKFASNKSNARRAAKVAGLDLDRLDFYQTADGRWTWRGKEVSTELTGDEDFGSGFGEAMAEARADEAPVRDVNEDTATEAGWTLTEGVVSDEPAAGKVEPAEPVESEPVKIILPVPAVAFVTVRIEAGLWDADRWASEVAAKLRTRTAAVYQDGTVGAWGGKEARGAKAEKAAPARKPAGKPRAARDFSVKPVVPPTFGGVQKLIDRIDAARGDAKALRNLNTFKRSATYTKLAGGFLDHLLAQATA